MKNIGLTLQYIWKNFFQLMCFSLVLAAALGIFFDVTRVFQSVAAVFEDAFQVLEGGFWRRAAVIVGVFAVMLVQIPPMFNYIERSFKTGRGSVRKGYAKIGYCVVIFPILLLYFAIFLLFDMLLRLVLSLLGGLSVAAVSTIAVIAVLADYLFAVLLLELLMYAVPNILYFGYNFGDALAGSIKIVNRKGRIAQIFFGMILPILFLLPVGALLFTAGAGTAAVKIVSVLCYMLVIMYYPAFVMISYADYRNVTRKDLERGVRFGRM